MNLGTSLARTSLLSSQNHLTLRFSHFPPNLISGFQWNRCRIQCRNHRSISESLAIETLESTSERIVLEPAEDLGKDTVEQFLSSRDNDNISRLMKMERKSGVTATHGRWFPYHDKFRAGDVELNSGEVVEALVPHLLEPRREKFRNVVKNRSYGVCLVVEGLTDLGNVSAAFRSADALGIQSVHVISCGSKRYRDNRHVSMGAEKWLDIEVWDSTQECFNMLKSRGYRIEIIDMLASWKEYSFHL